MSLMPVTVYRTAAGIIVERDEECTLLDGATMDDVFMQPDPRGWIESRMRSGTRTGPPGELLAPIGTQEVWAAGVTYLRSRDARMEESKDGGSVYDRVYAAERPELFFKATPNRVVAPGGAVRIRADSKWNVPEPEVALAINSAGRIFGYTAGNDMSSRDIEGENPLYLPQAKVYAGCCALGPGVLLRDPLPGETAIRLQIRRGGREVFAGATSLAQMKRGFEDLASWLLRENAFPTGCFLLTGTGLVPPNEFTLERGDEIAISVASVGTLRNVVA
jgi:2-dehydro-3-deoxy-D-arabinonate dehydratase